MLYVAKARADKAALIPAVLHIDDTARLQTVRKSYDPELYGLIEAFEAGRVSDALSLHRALLPLYTGIFKTQGAILVKAGLNVLGLPAGPMRAPLVNATEEETATLIDDAAAAGIALDPAGAAA